MQKIDIINKSFTMIGAAPIASIDDESVNARTANRVYSSALRSVLSECCWNFATARRLLAEVAVTLAWYESWENKVYARPSDCVRIFSTNSRYARWREEGDYIISDTAGLGVRYVYYLESASKYPASFVDALIDKLCSDMAFAILNSKSMGESMLEKYLKVTLVDAMAQNAQVGYQQEAVDDSWLNSRDTNGSPDA